MKKLIAVVLMLCLLIPCAVAEAPVDVKNLSALSFEELRSLYRQTMREMVTRPEWKEAEVHPGVYVVGEDIPAGSYCITADTDEYINIFLWGAELNDYDAGGGLIINESLYGDKNVMGKIILKDGNVLQLTGKVRISPVKGIWF